MKKIVFLLMLLSASFTKSFGQADEEAIKSVIQTAYVDGIQNRGTSESIRSGFHPTFTMLRLVDNEVKPYPIEEWIAAIEKDRSENKPALPKAVAKFVTIDITGKAAVVKLELYREGKKTFTDYLSLYQFSEGWKIVSKIYNRH